MRATCLIQVPDGHLLLIRVLSEMFLLFLFSSAPFLRLTEQVLPEFLSLSGSPFPEPPTTPNQPFPTLKETHDYLRGFAKQHLEQGTIRLNTEVVRVEELDDGKGWNVTTRDWSRSSSNRGEAHSQVWDAVVVCTGWYDEPLWPQTPGIEDLRKKGLAVHAKWYRGPQNYKGQVRQFNVFMFSALKLLVQRALIIGNGNSANDIASHLAPLAQNPVYRSIRRPAFAHFVSLPDLKIHDVAPVKQFILQDNGKVTVELQNETKIEGIDVVFIGSGYIPNPTFLFVRNPDAPSSVVPLMSQLSGQSLQSRRIPSLHKHILYAHNPTLAFIGSVMCYTPFTIADVSSAWLALIWGNEIPFPATPEGRLQFEKDRILDIESRRKIEAEETGREASALFTYSALGAAEEDYAADLKREVVEARPELKDRLPEWNEERRKWRQSMYAVKFRSLEWLKSQREVSNADSIVVANGGAA